MNTALVARTFVTITAPVADVWEALVTPARIKEYMFGATVTSEWIVGSPIVWMGVQQGRAYEDRGIILEFVPERILEYSHFSSLTGMADLPENYHIVTLRLSVDGARTQVSLSQDNNPTTQAREEAERQWSVILAGLKHVVERKRSNDRH
jgi:uncharacterized protein YndB with AHSA1/START domain